MAMICRTCPDADAARQLRQSLISNGVGSDHITLLLGSPEHDVRREIVGSFTGQVEPEAPVGKYSNARRARWRAAGGFVSRPDRLRQGSFADVDRTRVLTHDERGDHARVTTAAEARRLLLEAHVPSSSAERMLRELHGGGAVVMARLEAGDGRQPPT
jgi:hypothetical protein